MFPDDSHDPMLDGIHHADGGKVDFGDREFIKDLGQNAGFIDHKDGKLFLDPHGMTSP
jgi:hypothetical protein